MRCAPFELGADRREVVLGAVRRVCCERAWNLVAAHVRSTHVHVVLEGDGAPGRMVGDFKAYASRALRDAGLAAEGERIWAGGGYWRWLPDERRLSLAVRYVVDGQGEAMTVYEAGRR